ncbi:MAG TPA: hypothetical protein VLD63_10765, partial [Anaerolineales bacterium]|nr:hypothetical protein [Anaerolineales bacterium]
MIDNSLLMGIVLIGVGIALALIAYAVMLNRRDGEEPVEAEALEVEPAAEATAELSTEALEPPAEPVEPPPPRVAPAPMPPDAAAPPVSIQPTTGIPARRLLPVATLLREEVTGDLVIQVGDHVYRRVEDLRSSSDSARVQSVSADLARWLSRVTPKPPGAAREEAPAKPGSMIEQINLILEEKLAAAGSATRGVRLAEGPGGVVRVFIGVNSYPMEEVPDSEVRQLIRQ